PASRSRLVRTLADGQAWVEVKVFQGEARLVQDNIRLGQLKVKVPRRPAGQEAIDVRFTYDTSGLLEVEATVVSTSSRERAVIEGNPGMMSPDEIRRRLADLAALKVHPRDQAENTHAIARGQRLYEERLGAQRDEIGQWMDDFLIAIESQDPREISHARAAFTRHLDSIDQDFFL